MIWVIVALVVGIVIGYCSNNKPENQVKCDHLYMLTHQTSHISNRTGNTVGITRHYICDKCFHVKNVTVGDS